MSVRISDRCEEIFLLKILISPEVGVIKERRVRIVVLFPAPLGPKNP